MIRYLLASEILLCAGAGAGGLFLKLRRSRLLKWRSEQAKTPCENLLDLQAKYGYNEHSFVGMSVQPEVWTDDEQKGAVSYTENGNIWIVAGDPLVCQEDLPSITKKFIERAQLLGKAVAFLPTTEKFARAIADQDLRIIKVGASPYFDLKQWDPKGNSAKKLRLGVNRGRRGGVVVEQTDQITDDFRREAEELSSQWSGRRRAGVSFGWIFEVKPFQDHSSRKYFTARTPDGKLVGLLAASPIPARNGWYLEDVLRDQDAPDGTSDLLVFEALQHLARCGADIATLGTVPLSLKGCSDLSKGRNAIIEWCIGFSRTRLNSLYNFEGLGTFKSKFVPTWWESEYIVFSRGRLIPPRVVNAIFNIILPGGLLQVLKILISFQDNA